MQSDQVDRLSRDPRLWVAACVVILGAVVAFRAAFSAYFVLDDFAMLAIVRFLDNPLAPFVGEHIPGAVHYRPLGMSLWWASEQLFGSTPWAHYALNLALHLGVGAALWRLIACTCDSRWAGFVAAACFTCHPIGLGTTLWLSDRFDLLALLFMLFGLCFADEYSRTAGRRALAASVCLLGLGLLSKEIALAAFVATAVIWMHTVEPIKQKAGAKAIALLVLVGAMYFVVRSAALPNPSAGWLPSLLRQFDQLVLGGSIWLRGWVGYTSFWGLLNGWKSTLAWAGYVLIGALTVAALFQPWTTRRRVHVLAGLALLLSTAVLQWPVLAFQDLRADESRGAIQLAHHARYFYAGYAGGLVALAGILTPLCSRNRLSRRLLALAIVAVLLPWLLASQHLVRSYRNATLEQRAIVEAATAPIEQMDIPDRSCQIYLLDTGNWMFAWFSDTAIKAVFPDLPRISHCLIQTEHTPWYHIARVEHFDTDALYPLRPIHGADESRATQAIGRGRFLYLNLPPEADLSRMSAARFLSWRNGTFVDITSDVLAGRHATGFLCNRSAEECLP
jgi:hypothetical protein